MSHKLLSLCITAGILIPNVVLAEQTVVPQSNSNAIALQKKQFKKLNTAQAEKLAIALK